MPIKTQSAESALSRFPAPQQAKGPPDLNSTVQVKPSKSKPYKDLEGPFDARWSRAFPDLELTPEHRFHPIRKWRFDFAHEATKIAIELEGGIWGDGAHTRGKHYESDCEKYNAAGSLGWTVFRLTTDMSRDGKQLHQIAATIRERLQEVPDVSEKLAARGP